MNDQRAAIALSGGRTPWRVLEALAEHDLEWWNVDVFQVDERIVPADDEQRNLRGIEASLASRVPVRLHAMPVEAGDPDAAARAYERELPDGLDLVVLGLGADGHTASLVPGDPALEITDRAVALTGEYQGTRRMTLTFPGLARAREVVWLVTGNDKRDALRRLIGGDRSIPATRVDVTHQILLTDLAVDGTSGPD